MAERVDLFDSTYSHFTRSVLDVIRKETFGVIELTAGPAQEKFGCRVRASAGPTRVRRSTPSVLRTQGPAEARTGA
jgi:hypothetical protein